MTGVDHSQELASLQALFANPTACRDSFREAITLAIRLSALGHAEDVLRMAQQSSEKALLCPLTEGLRLHLGMVIASTGAARSLAIHIAGKIRHESERLNGACTAV